MATGRQSHDCCCASHSAQLVLKWVACMKPCATKLPHGLKHQRRHGWSTGRQGKPASSDGVKDNINNVLIRQ